MGSVSIPTQLLAFPNPSLHTKWRHGSPVAKSSSLNDLLEGTTAIEVGCFRQPLSGMGCMNSFAKLEYVKQKQMKEERQRPRVMETESQTVEAKVLAENTHGPRDRLPGSL